MAPGSSLTFRLGHRLATDRVQGSVTITITNSGHGNPPPTLDTTSSVDNWIEDSVMITAEHLRTDSCHLPVDHHDIRDDHTVVIRTRDESAPGEALVSPPPVSEETMTSPPPDSGATMEAESPRLDITSPRGENSPISSPLVISTVDVHPLRGEETMSSSPPKSNATLTLPPHEGEENKTLSSSVIETPVMSPEETMSLLSRSSREEMTSPPRNGKALSQYQRLWSWDDAAATPIRSLPPPTQFRRAATCRNRPRPHQQQQRQLNVAVLRRGGGGSFHTSSFHHSGHHSLNLPPNWDMRMDSAGRHVYVNHSDRSVTADHPSLTSRQSSIVSCSRQGSVNEELGRYNERVNYQHASTLHLYKDIEEEELIRSTSTTGDQLADHSGKGIDQATENTTTEHDQRTPENNQPSNQDDQSAVLITDQTTTSISESDTAKTLERTPSVEPTDAASPAYQFITWHDVYAYMRSEGVKEIGDEFFSNLPVVKLFQHIRANHSTFKKYQHHPKLIACLNKFAQTDCELPNNWEKRLDQNGRAVYVNHNNRSTSFVDPRLPYPGNKLVKSSSKANWRTAARDRLEGIGANTRANNTTSINTSTTTTSTTTNTTITTTRTLTRLPADDDDDSLVLGGRPRSHSLPLPEQTLRTRNRRRQVLPSNQDRIAPRLESLSSGLADNRPRPAQHTNQTDDEPASDETEEEVYQRRVVEFLRQDNIYSIISDRYDGPITEDLRMAIDNIAEVGPDALRSLDSDSEVTFQLGLIFSLFEDAIIHRQRLPTMPSPRRHISPPPALPRPSTPPPRPSTPPPPETLEPLSQELLESTSMTQFGFTEGALNRFFTRDDITEVLQLAGYMSTTITGMLRTIASSGMGGLLSQGHHDTIRILKFVIDTLLSQIEEHTGETRNTNIILHTDLPAVDLLTNAQILAFFVQPNIFDILLQRYTNVPPLMRIVVLTIQSEGEAAIARGRYVDSNLAKLIRDFNEEIKAFSSPVMPQEEEEQPVITAVIPTEQMKSIFSIKLQQFHDKLLSAGYRSRSQRSLTVSRDTLLHDAYEEVMSCNSRDLRKMVITISFYEEEGLDYGGPSREFYFFVSRELFNPYYGLFEYSSVGSYTVQVSPHSLDIPDALQWFRFAGRFVGMAVVQGYLVDVFFARHVYKALLGKPYSIEDLQVIDLEFFNSLKYVLDNDPEPLALTFAIEEQSFGVIKECELMKGGSGIAVMEDNKRQYVDLMVEYRLSKGSTKQTEAFVKGFREMIPPSILNFDPHELEWLIAGQAQIDLEDWKSNTTYWGYEENSEVITWFWKVVEEYSNEQRLRLLQFVTGTSSIPLEGFKGLKNSDGSYQVFTIDMDYSEYGDEAFPRAHTCFNRIDLPAYSSHEVLKSKLTRAIEETEAFGNA
ncbi:E3 ubiquitin-protein ligase HECW1-like isoform X3 [Dysidea avara]|uniref:E3 ubiquitin-protein ligase HECW1-like isoform X3 n=1 Tax=Dysidea avara TaxID=196820 RepID=UPI00332ED730